MVEYSCHCCFSSFLGKLQDDWYTSCGWEARNLPLHSLPTIYNDCDFLWSFSITLWAVGFPWRHAWLSPRVLCSGIVCWTCSKQCSPKKDSEGFPGGVGGKESTCQCRRIKRPEFDPWVGKIPWRKKMAPHSNILAYQSHGQRNLAGYSPWGCKNSHTTEHIKKKKDSRWEGGIGSVVC